MDRGRSVRADDHTEWLIQRLLNHREHRENRCAAVRALARTPTASGMLALVTATEDGDTELRKAALQSLATCGPPGVAALAAFLPPDIPEALVAARGLGLTQHPHAREVLGPYLADPRPWVALEAGISLGRMGDYRAVETLCRLLTAQLPASVHGPESMQSLVAAVSVLGLLRDPRAVETLCLCLTAAAPLATAAAHSLSQIGNPWAVEPLCIALLRGITPAVREAAATALATFADPRSVRSLSLALADSAPSVKNAAAAALTWFTDATLHQVLSGSVDPLLTAYLERPLNSDDYPAMFQAARLAGILEIVSLLQTLNKRLRNLPRSDKQLRAILRHAISAIETRIAAVRNCPIPAFAPEPSIRQLPLPNDSAAGLPSTLPRVPAHEGFPEDV